MFCTKACGLLSEKKEQPNIPFDHSALDMEVRKDAESVELRPPMLCNSPVLDYLNMRDEGGLVKGLVKVEIACFGQHRR